MYEEIVNFSTLVIPDFINLIGLIFIIIVLALVGKVALAMSNRDDISRIKAIWDLVDDAIYNASLSLIGYTLASGEELAAEYLDKYNEVIDPRLAWVIKQAELRVESYVAFDFDFFEVLRHAQNIYDTRVKRPF